MDGAEPGILMQASPANGLSYMQEYYEDEAEDMGKVLKLNARVWYSLKNSRAEKRFWSNGWMFSKTTTEKVPNKID